MDKQILNRVNSVGSLQEAGGHSAAEIEKSSSRVSTKCTVILVVIGILAVLVGCAVVFAAVGASRAVGAKLQKSEQETTGDPLIGTAEKEQLLKKVK